jgi:isopropylmalate/homocitrate/citramalate synthase
VPQATLVLGKHSGRHAVQRRCEQIGLAVTQRQELDAVYRAVIALADREKVVTDADLASIVARARGRQQHSVFMVASAQDFASTPAESGYGHGV